MGRTWIWTCDLTLASATADSLAFWLITTPSAPTVARVGIPRTPHRAASVRLRVASPNGIAAQGISLKYLLMQTWRRQHYTIDSYMLRNKRVV